MARMTDEVKEKRPNRLKAKKGGSVPVPVIALGLTAAIMIGAYAALCGWAGARTVFYPNETISGVPVGGLTVEAATQTLANSLPVQTLTISTSQKAKDALWTKEAEPVSVPLGDLGYTAERCADIAQRHFEEQQETSFLSRGARVLSILTDTGEGGLTAADRDESAFQAGVADLAKKLSMEALDGSYQVLDDQILMTKEANGRSISASALATALESALENGEQEVEVKYDLPEGQPLSMVEIHDEVIGEMRNASYDAATGQIIPEQRGASFDTVSAQRMLASAAPGETVSVPAEIQEPEITAESLKKVLFRDLLGECTTHVGGTTARLTNVRLASAAFNGTVLNSGEVFSYNQTVGQRTEAKGYKAAPAYVQGETVDEIGGGVCQPSSTLYYACLLANLEITERYAHRYIPSYITRGMDATVSWGGPDYRFTNDTSYPIKIVTNYQNNNLTVQIWGTKTNDLSVKMTYETLSTTPFKDVEQQDDSLAPGARKVKVTPYTGYRVKTYRNIYDGAGNLISSGEEAISDYKSRDRVTLVGPAKTTTPASTTAPNVPDTPNEQIPGTPAEQEPQTPATTEPNVPAAAPAEVPAQTPAPAEPAAPENPPNVVVIDPEAEGAL